MSRNLLIVDDELDLLKMLNLILSGLADEVFLASNGLEALKVIETKQVNCILCDINMPKMNGVQLLQEIRSKNNHVPFIFYTGHGNDELRETARSLGVTDFFNKPNMDGLEDTIERILGTETLTKSIA